MNKKKINSLLLFKALIYRVTSSLLTFVLAWIISNRIDIGIVIGIVDAILKITFYYFFDVCWNHRISSKYKPRVIWLTGLSGSGKTTIANQLSSYLFSKGIKSIILDGDDIRSVFNQVGFDKDSRIKHNMNVAYMASLFEKQGFIVIVSLISPYEQGRQESRKICKSYFEIYLSTPLGLCEMRDVKGLYGKARQGLIKNFTGVTDIYEVPANPELSIDTSNMPINESVGVILNRIFK